MAEPAFTYMSTMQPKLCELESTLQLNSNVLPFLNPLMGVDIQRYSLRMLDSQQT
jgi:hypothetical protein